VNQSITSRLRDREQNPANVVGGRVPERLNFFALRKFWKISGYRSRSNLLRKFDCLFSVSEHNSRKFVHNFFDIFLIFKKYYSAHKPTGRDVLGDMVIYVAQKWKNHRCVCQRVAIKWKSKLKLVYFQSHNLQYLTVFKDPKWVTSPLKFYSFRIDN